MHINTFWKIIIKGIGLSLLISCVDVIPQYMSTLNFINESLDWYNLLLVWGLCSLTIVFYLFVIRLLLIKTDWFIKILKLDKNFTEERIDINLPPKTILSIVITIIAAVWFLRSLPNLVISFFDFSNQNELITQYAESGWLIYNFFSTICSFLIMTNAKYISNYLWKKNITLE